VNLVVECFGPTDLIRMLDGQKSEKASHLDLEIFSALTRGLDVQKVLWEMSPVSHVKPGGKYPPFLLIHGDADEMVPYDQMMIMYHALYDQGADVRAICVDGAPHEDSFWSRELYDIILNFIREKL
jgi:dipeptidyl aminopeptidase/acylaminoacyl peptidase